MGHQYTAHLEEVDRRQRGEIAKLRAALTVFVSSVVQRSPEGNIYALGELHAAEKEARLVLGLNE